MSHNSPLAQNPPGTIRTPSACLLRYGYLGFRFMRYQCSPWLVLAIAPFKLLCASEAERIRLQLRCFSAIARIDFVRIYGLLNELLV
ncbi:MAG: hypothetical protein VKK80_00200 [Prochlorothrix sp.]|nr:hypothetical protein [Prochlorothrix sp.]